MSFRLLAGFGALALACACSEAARGFQGDEQSALAAAPPYGVAHMFAEAGVPAGLEIREGDVIDRTRYVLDLIRLRTLSQEQIIDAFNRQRSVYQAALVNGVIVIRPTTNRSPQLDSPAPSMLVDEIGVMRAMWRLFGPVTPGPLPGGRVGSRLSTDGVEVDFGDGIHVTADWTRESVLSALNNLARMAPGHVWVVVTSDDGQAITRAGFAHGKGHATFVPVSR